MASQTLEVIIKARDQFTSTANKILGSLGQMESKAAAIGRVAGRAAVAGVGLAALAIGQSARAGIAALEQLEEANAQTAAAINSTGGIAGISATDVRRMSEAFEDLNALFDDKLVQSAANVLLTFTNIRKEAFEPTMEAALDLSVRMKQDLGTSILQVGKALNDPISGLTALRRVGVQFTDQQEDQIKALVKSGDLLGAQKLILAELNKEFGGSFLAQGQTSRAKLAAFGDAIEDLQATFAEGLLPAIVDVAGALKKSLSDPAIKADIAAFGRSLGSLLSPQNIQTLVSGAGTVLGIIKTAVGLFTSLPPELQKLAIGALAVNKLTGGGLMSLAGLALSSLRTITAPHVTVIGGTVSGGAPGAAAGTGIGVLGTVLSGAAVAGALAAVHQMVIMPQLQERAAANISGAEGMIARGNLDEMLGALQGLKEMPDRLNPLQRVLYDLNAQGVRVHTESLEYALAAAASKIAGAANNAFLYQHTIRENTTVTISSRDVTTAAASAGSYGPTSSSYYGGSTAPSYSH